MRFLLLMLALAGCTQSAPPGIHDGKVRLWYLGTVYAVYDEQARTLTITDQGHAAGVTCK